MKPKAKALFFLVVSYIKHPTLIIHMELLCNYRATTKKYRNTSKHVAFKASNYNLAEHLVLHLFSSPCFCGHVEKISSDQTHNIHVNLKEIYGQH